MQNKSVQGFKVLPLYFSEENCTHHEIFIKEHCVRNYEESKPPGRTLFAINIPPYATEDALKNVFSAAGTVSSVILTCESEGFKVAFIVFEKHEGLKKALELESLNPLSSSESPVIVGLSKWIQDYNNSVYDIQDLSKEVNEAIKKYDDEEEKRKAAEKDKVDDDGWTVVTQKGRNPGLSRKESVENKLIQKNKIKSRKKELKNFYTFQLKEQKMKSIIALRKNFQDSKEKVKLMKQKRNFKPF